MPCLGRGRPGRRLGLSIEGFMATGRLVILTGPSCVGKSPLAKVLARCRPDLAARLQPIILFNSRDPRPAERDGVDYHFRTRDEIEALRTKDDRYVVMDVRGDLQALDLEDVHTLLERGDAFFEGNPFVARRLVTDAALQDVPRLGVFLAPLSRSEIESIKRQRAVSPSDLVADLMRRKLLRRTTRQKGILSLRDLENIERRCGSAYTELKLAHLFEHVIPNHDGEDSEHWDAFAIPVGDAGRAVAAMVALLEGRTAEVVERWDEALLPD
jgi:guanylate kinase